MEKLEWKGTKQYPEILFYPVQGEFIYRGCVICEDTIAFHRPVIDMLSEFNRIYPDKPLKVIFGLEYTNTQGSKSINNIFGLIKAHCKSSHNQVTIRWYFNKDDEDIFNLGEDLRYHFNIPLELIEIDEYDDPLRIRRSGESPEVFFHKAEGIFEIKGNSITEKPIEFFQPLIRPIESMVWNNKEKHYTINIIIESCNRGSKDYIQRILSFFNECENVTAKWYYKQGNEEMHSLGQILKSELKYDLELIQI
ncbi:MAG: DUF1987 family protein [Bacteroidales bacterium]|nr:DUF1987 family protein [Bacteroidales bacterium]